MIDSDLIGILLPALVAGLIVLGTHIPLGKQVLKRNIIFIDLAIAQIAALGAIMAELHHNEWTSEHWHWLLPIAFALAGALLISQLEKLVRHELEAFIGLLYVLAAVSGVLVLADSPHGDELLQSMLAGQILWTDWGDLFVPAIVSAVLVGLWIWFPPQQNATIFYLSFAVAITLSVQLVGVYLVFTSLIVPAVATSALKSYRTTIAVIIGVLGYFLGLLSSLLFDLPSGAAIVATLITVGLCSKVIIALLYKSGAVARS